MDKSDAVWKRVGFPEKGLFCPYRLNCNHQNNCDSFKVILLSLGRDRKFTKLNYCINVHKQADQSMKVIEKCKRYLFVHDAN